MVARVCERRGVAVDDGQHLRPRVAEPLGHLHRPAGIAADAEDQQRVLGLDPQQLVGGGHGARAQLVHAGAAHVQVQRQPGGHGRAVDLREHKDAPFALRDARHDGLERRHVQPVARGGDVVLVVQQGVVHTLLQAALGADGDGRALPGGLQQRRDLAPRLALRLGITRVAELGKQPHHGGCAGARARRQRGGRLQQRVRVVAPQRLGQGALAGGEFAALAGQALGQQCGG